MTNNTISQQGKINLSMVNSHKKIISGIINILISYTGTAEWRNQFRKDHHSYKRNTIHIHSMQYHSYSHSAISTTAGQLAWQFLIDWWEIVSLLDVMWPRGCPVPRGIFEDLHKISPRINRSKRRGYHEGSTFTRVAGIRKKCDRSTFYYSLAVLQHGCFLIMLAWYSLTNMLSIQLAL